MTTLTGNTNGYTYTFNYTTTSDNTIIGTLLRNGQEFHKGLYKSREGYKELTPLDAFRLSIMECDGLGIK